MKELNDGVMSFGILREGNFLYVDKTQYIYNLVRKGAGYYFLSRPRRFGKSLLVSTMEQLMQGHRELFRGLWIDSSGYDFKPYPVLRLDMSLSPVDTPEKLEDSLVKKLLERAEEEGVAVRRTDGPFADETPIASEILENLIKRLYEKYGERVVVLIDEYDYPLLAHITNPETASRMLGFLRGFYIILKGMNEYLRFSFMTGVSKFAHTSIFSGSNQFTDITLEDEFAAICGFTKEEFESAFAEQIAALDVSRMNLKEGKTVLDQIYAWYDGYSWDGVTKLLNPVSVISLLRKKRFGNYWFTTGTPNFLFRIIEQDPGLYVNPEKGCSITADSLDAMAMENPDLLPLLFQTGYLTMASPIDAEGDIALAYPNLEVRSSYTEGLFRELTGLKPSDIKETRRNLGTALRTADIELLEKTLRASFASIPYHHHIAEEKYYHTVFKVMLDMLGADTVSETASAYGRSDIIVTIPKNRWFPDGLVYGMELKYEPCDKDAKEEEKKKLLEAGIKEALKQIGTMGYMKPYAAGKDEIIKLGVSIVGRGDVMVRRDTGNQGCGSENIL